MELEVEEDSVNAYVYNAACLNLAELGPAETKIDFEVIEGTGFTIKSNTKEFVSELSFNLAVQTNKDASCFFAQDKEVLGEKKN